MSYKLQAASDTLLLTSCKLQATAYELQAEKGGEDEDAEIGAKAAKARGDADALVACSL